MKKLSFILAMVLGTGMAMAQTDNSATIKQVSKSSFNKNIVTQTDNSNILDVKQDGYYSNTLISNQYYDNAARLEQTGEGTNYANIKQGSGNFLGLVQEWGAVDFTQAATQLATENNELWLTQNGNANKAYLNQDAKSGSNYAEITQGGNDFTQVYQDAGTYNYSYVNQW